MNLLFYISHPAQFHFFKNTIDVLKGNGHNVDIVAKTKDVLVELINEKGWSYTNILSKERGRSLLAICLSLIKRDFKLFFHCFGKKYDLFLGTDASIAHVGKIMRVPVITVLEDDYKVIKKLAHMAYPFTSHIFTPHICDVDKWEGKKIGYNGYMKLAYLHPNWFLPRKNLIRQTKVPYSLIRLSGLKAHHDFGIKGITIENLKEIISKLSKNGEVYISSENPLPEEFKKYSLDISPSKIHHYLSYADLLVCDSQSMAVEAAMLGTPSIRISSFSGRISVLEELELKYKLTFGFRPEDIKSAIAKIDELLFYDLKKNEFEVRRHAMLNDMLDVSSLLIWLIEKYPNSVSKYQKDPYIAERFLYRQKTKVEEKAPPKEIKKPIQLKV